MNDRELLELAAKAAGIGPIIGEANGALIIGPAMHLRIWDPLTQEIDALRLAVKLGINIIFEGNRHYVGRNRFMTDVCCEGGLEQIMFEIVNAAAEIGRNMP